MSSSPTRQHYDIATGGGQKPTPERTAGTPGFKKGGPVKKSAGGSTYKKGGKSGR